MSIPPTVVATARIGWKWQWNQLMNGLAPSDSGGNYLRPKSEHKKAKAISADELKKLSWDKLPRLIIGRSCPWAHRTWLVHQFKSLENSLVLLIAKADHNSGRWLLDPPWERCDSLLDLYKLCGEPPIHRATVPTLIKPALLKNQRPLLLGNESAQLVEVLNEWPSQNKASDLAPVALQKEIDSWQKLLQPKVNDGVYRCGFARTQSAYDKASTELFNTLEFVDKSLSKQGPWLCGKQLTLADFRLFPTLIRWESVYVPLFGCCKEPLWKYKNLWEWRRRFFAQPFVAATCDSISWRKDYFGALFPLRPSGIVPEGPDLSSLVNSSPP